MILLIDNYDSFSYNLYQLIGSINPDIRVVRNDAMTPEEMLALNPAALVISPGPGRPEDAGVCIDAIRALGGKMPILGVCLGHQAICAAYGATVSYAKELMHGKQSGTKLDTNCPLFADLPETIPVARYHSLAAVEETIPACLQVVARTQDGEVMAVKHRDFDTYGLQFHPESILTPNGPVILQNFLGMTKETRKQ
ncbi:MAG: aminodeoxychorismate/anthranilate synthase component II [Christensenella sp.]|nr:aminodeoxychorismate/anthranilate synthase component II [Christensenella sp.]